MSLETDLFKRMECDEAKLQKYGFQKQGSEYCYETVLKTDEMKAVVYVSEKGTVAGKVIDPFSNEEYIAVHLPRQKGAYVSQIRSEYLEVLADVAQKCFHPVPFIYPQTNRINALICQKYHMKCSFPFTKYPHIGAYYHPQNQKWFGLVQCVDRTVFQKEQGECEILNLKADQTEMEEQLKRQGIYPGYHMSKKAWISVILDETFADDEIMKLVEESFQLTLGGSARNGIKKWIIPANPAYFDLDHAFRQTDEIHWKQTAKMMVGDMVYIYYGAPYSEIRYLCRVTAVNIPADYHGKVTIKKMMKIKKLYRYEGGQINRKVLKKYGIVSVRGQRYIPEDLIIEIERLYPKSIQK